MVGGIFYEHGHRMVATFVGLLTIILAVWLWRNEQRQWVRILGAIALLAVITQGVLGGITVLYLLPTWVSTTHATIAQSFFSLTVFLAIVTSSAWGNATPSSARFGWKTRRLAVASAGTVLLQLVLGALMRHSGSGMAIPDFPLSYSHWIPPLDAKALQSLNEYRLVYYDLPPVELSQIWIHFAHRLGAVLVTVVVLMNVVHILKHYSDHRLREAALIQGMLVLFQFLLGALTVWTGRGVQIATAHVAVGALLLATSVALAAWTYHLLERPSTETEEALAAEPA